MSRTKMTALADHEYKRSKPDDDVVGTSASDRQRPKTRSSASRSDASSPRRRRRRHIKDFDFYFGDDEGPCLSEDVLATPTSKRKRCIHSHSQPSEPPQKRTRKRWSTETPLNSRPRHFRTLPYIPDSCLLKVYASDQGPLPSR